MGSALLRRLQGTPLPWVAFGFALLVLALIGPSAEPAFSSDSAALDHGFVEVLREHPTDYAVAPELPQTYGAHVLSRYAVAGVSFLTGDAYRAGLWLSLASVTVMLGGMYALARRVFPLRGFAAATTVAAAGLGSVHHALSPTPSTALGMALVVWGTVAFLSSLERNQPQRVFFSAVLFGLAGYVRIELGLLWVVPAIYLLLMSVFDSPPRARGLPLAGMALGGLLTVAVVVWPMVDRNMELAGSPLLPGPGAELILGAPVLLARAWGLAIGARLMERFGILLAPVGLGVFAGLLCPLGALLRTGMGRNKPTPFFWLPAMVLMAVLLAGLSLVTGLESFRECLVILTPVLLPLALLVPAYAVFRWLEARPQSQWIGLGAWAGTTLLLFLLVRIPALVGASPDTYARTGEELVEGFERLPEPEAAVLTDMPGTLLAADKSGVYGMGGETDWRGFSAKYAGGEFRVEELLAYMDKRDIRYLHLSDVGDSLPDELQSAEGAPRLEKIDAFSPPHRVFRVVWP